MASSTKVDSIVKEIVHQQNRFNFNYENLFDETKLRRKSKRNSLDKWKLNQKK